MARALWLVPALPMAGFLCLGLAGSRLSRRAAAAVGVGSVGLAAAISLGLAAGFAGAPAAERVETQLLWSWIDTEGWRADFALRLDALSLVMTLVVTVVGFLIHLYSAEFMEGEDEGYARFFAYMNLFVAAMLLLVLADDLLLLYLGWEGVGLCSYLLIGFWYRDPANGRAARKAFVVTRVGDAAMILGLLLLFTRLGTLRIPELLERAVAEWEIGSGVAVAAAALLLGGAVGKSAQLPLQTWLPDAMAGPTPVSALIHAATMVTAGVYLIARTRPLFELAPPVMSAVALVGAATLLLAGFSALAQRDIKRVLAYSTISQIGYMFLALGVGAWSAAIFHLMTHAFFKALLFLAAGVVIVVLHHEHDILKMGGLRRRMPFVFWTFLIAGASLAGLPLITAGFYSKDRILWLVWSAERGGVWLWAAGSVGALLTSIYVFRVVFCVFFGEERSRPEGRPGFRILLPLGVLAGLSVVGGFVEVPAPLGGAHRFSGFLAGVFPGEQHATHGTAGAEIALQVVAGLVALGGIGLAWVAHGHRPRGAIEAPPAASALHRLWQRGWGFDALYDALLVRPLVALARINRADVIDRVYAGIARLARVGHATLRPTQNGKLRWYAAGVAFGAVLVLALVVLR